MKRVFQFSRNEPVYGSDIRPLMLASRAFPEADLYLFDDPYVKKMGTIECMTFVLAHSSQEAYELYMAACGDDYHIEPVTPEHFTLDYSGGP